MAFKSLFARETHVQPVSTDYLENVHEWQPYSAVCTQMFY